MFRRYWKRNHDWTIHEQLNFHWSKSNAWKLHWIIQIITSPNFNLIFSTHSSLLPQIICVGIFFSKPLLCQHFQHISLLTKWCTQRKISQLKSQQLPLITLLKKVFFKHVVQHNLCRFQKTSSAMLNTVQMCKHCIEICGQAPFIWPKYLHCTPFECLFDTV